MRCSPIAGFDGNKTPGDPFWYTKQNFHMAKDFVKSLELEGEFRQSEKCRLVPAASATSKAKGKGSKRALDDTDRDGPASAQRKS